MASGTRAKDGETTKDMKHGKTRMECVGPCLRFFLLLAFFWGLGGVATPADVTNGTVSADIENPVLMDAHSVRRVWIAEAFSPGNFNHNGVGIVWKALEPRTWSSRRVTG